MSVAALRAPFGGWGRGPPQKGKGFKCITQLNFEML